MPISKDVLSKYAGNIFIETGTYLGQTVQMALELGFKKIYSIEINKKLYRKARSKFKKNKNVLLFKGNSIEILPEILKQVESPAVFWLDAHESGPGLEGGKILYPVLVELDIISKHSIKEHTILIDDRRLFESFWNIKEVDVVKRIYEINENYGISYEKGIIENDILVARINDFSARNRIFII
jgi:hypothetical protein